MSVLRRSLPLVAALVLLSIAAAFALLAVDVRAWQGTLRRDDVRFAALHSPPGLWRSPAIFPGDPAQHILGLGDGLAYRHALQLFWLSEVGVKNAGGLTQTRIDTQEDLAALMRDARTDAERSSAANLLGVMTMTTPNADSATRSQMVLRATAYFRQAVVDDPGDYAAKLNLELALRLQRPVVSRFGQDASGGFGSGGSHGADKHGGGY